MAWALVWRSTYSRLVNPWWVTRSEAETHTTTERRRQVLTPAPALWSFVAIFVTIVLTPSAAAT